MNTRIFPLMLLLVVVAMTGCDTQALSTDSPFDAVVAAKNGGGGGNHGGGTNNNDLPPATVTITGGTLVDPDGLASRIGTGYAVVFDGDAGYDGGAVSPGCGNFHFGLMEVQASGSIIDRVKLYGYDGNGRNVESAWVDIDPVPAFATDDDVPVNRDLDMLEGNGRHATSVCIVGVGTLHYDFQ